MVDHHSEDACGLLSQKASPVAMGLANTDNLQELDAAWSPKMAPTTPMQEWQKPQQARKSPDAVPSLFLGRGSELKGAFMKLHAVTHKPIPARCGLANWSTSSELHGRIGREGHQHHDESLMSFCLSKYEKKCQTPDTATPLRNHTGPCSLHRVHAHAGHLSTLLAEACTCPRGHVTHLDTQGLCAGLKMLPEEDPLHAEEPEKKLCSTPTCMTASTNDVEVNDSTALYSPAPGEVAHDAYELYSKMFPPACTAAAECSPSSIDADAGLYLSSPFLEHMDNIQLLPPSYDQKPLVRDRGELGDDLSESGKKIKFAKNKEEDTPGGFLDVKQEMIFYEPRCTADVKISSTAPSHWDRKPFQMPPESLSTVLCSPNSCKLIHSIDYAGGCARHGSAEVTSIQPVGLKLVTSSSAYMHMPKTSSMSTGGEPSVPLSLEPSTRVPSTTPAQGSSSLDADWGRYLALSAMPTGNTETAIMLPFQQRFKELQAFLKQCDEGDPHECIQALRTLSAAARSGYAVNLETRAIRLSLEEGKEMKRMRLLNVLGKISEGNLDNTGATPHGRRLPAPRATPTPEDVP